MLSRRRVAGAPPPPPKKSRPAPPGGATADLTPRTLDQRRAWVESHAPRTRYPVVVMEDGAGEVVAFGSLSQYHEREGYDGVDELSYYVDERHRQAGYGSRMVDWLLSAARERGVRMAVTLIFAENAGSTALMHRFGFHRFGLLPRACSDGSRLLDMSYWYLDL
ncbi:MAG: N-acetyltransferase family protein [Bifidobacterium mongoliense]|nr:GNAT family N-acetyltransferase [Bifidobacterium mongoliense]MDN6783495.1 N-acetyltransferase family protein [Bifidobacterium mongoliense]